MIWELIPEGQKSTFDDYEAGFVSKGPGSYGHRDQTNELFGAIKLGVSVSSDMVTMRLLQSFGCY